MISLIILTLKTPIISSKDGLQNYVSLIHHIKSFPNWFNIKAYTQKKNRDDQHTDIYTFERTAAVEEEQK